MTITTKGRNVLELMDLCGWNSVVDAKGNIYKLTLGKRDKHEFQGRKLNDDGTLGRNKRFRYDGSVQTCEGKL